MAGKCTIANVIQKMHKLTLAVASHIRTSKWMYDGVARLLNLGFPAKACEMKVLRQLAIRYYRTPFLFYGGKRSRLRNSQLIPLLHNSSWEDGATASLP